MAVPTCYLEGKNPEAGHNNNISVIYYVRISPRSTQREHRYNSEVFTGKYNIPIFRAKIYF